MSLLTPRRRRDFEILDDPDVDDRTRVRSTEDIVRSNRLLGGARAVRRALDPALARLAAEGVREATLLDVGTGLGDLAALARGLAARHGVRLATLALDVAPSLVGEARRVGRVDHPFCASALALPLADASVDIVLCSQLLHHFEHADARRVLGELTRVARRVAIVGDLRRSWLAAAGFWLASWPLRFHPATRHDGVVSVLRGFTAGELRELVRDAAGTTAVVRRHLGYRLTATWSPESLPLP